MSLYGYQFGSKPPTEEPEDGNVPGNSNEDTIPTGEDDGNDGDDSEEETPIGANEPRVFAHEVLDEIEDIIESFRDGSISKGVATFNIIECLDGADTTPVARHTALDYYVDTLDRIQKQLEEQNKRARAVTDGWGRRGDGRSDRIVQPKKEHESGEFERRERSDREKGRRTEKLDVTRLPWHGRETLDQELGNPSCIRTRKLLKLFRRDYAEVKRQIELSGTAPVGFPSDQWDKIIRCKAVNLDVILSSLHHVGAPKENVRRIGHTEISFGRREPIRKVETAGQWQSAFNAYVKAVRFAFEHREQELRDYMEYIEGLFSSRVASAHPEVILFDKAVREEVGGGQRILLTDTNRFMLEGLPVYVKFPSLLHTRRSASNINALINSARSLAHQNLMERREARKNEKGKTDAQDNGSAPQAPDRANVATDDYAF
ncbi:hypothetical protein LshimejAT787_3400090 [Lyophyllum shimeji]|uniref:Uncharacterized protein n=1 Tax=Lyophyllum shimeji TaxID=47721 RepID=A0A9P3UTB3_LYOSH|nr:hypothetical protein LshimejAT787_1005810 [Lyophyllum shimeji]GLB45752.1 hypothetical protein LshimejAT787_2700220 [Lyophyllum shimeji]GLB45869.1 hypothetical protein LshimejAT787_3400090 [Lyophyllum shimeji]